MAARPRSRRSSKAKKPGERVGLGGGSVDKNLSKPRKSNWMSIGDGNTEVVRAVDQKKLFKDGYVHPVEFDRKDKSTYTVDRWCLDQEEEGDPCPGCRDELERRYKFWMVVIQRGEKRDQLRLLSGGKRLVKALNAKAKRRDLSKRDMEISQSGTGFDVEYEAEWAEDQDSALSKADQALIDRGDKVMETFEYATQERTEDDFYDPPSRDNDDDDDDDDDVGTRTKRRGSAFTRERKKGTLRSKRDEEEEDDDEDDEDEDERPARRRKSKSSSSKPKSGALGGLKKKSSGSSKPKIRSRK